MVSKLTYQPMNAQHKNNSDGLLGTEMSRVY
jgi:hypothetical protein